MSKTWCPLPWNHLSVRNNGDLRVCCHANTSSERGILRDEIGAPLRADQKEWSEIRNSPQLKEVREKMLKGEWHSFCVRCEREEASGMRSRRSYESDFWMNDVSEERIHKYTSSDGTIDVDKFPLNYYDLRFGNLCNLKCRMCGPTDSSKWYSDHVKMHGNEFHDTHGKVKLEEVSKNSFKALEDPYGWHENESFWLKLEKDIPTAKHFYFVGGEPLIIDRHYGFLKKILESGRSKEITIEYNTNLSVVPQRAWDLWGEFKQVKLGISMDGVGTVCEYIRHPMKWERFETNLEKLENFKGNYAAWFAVTIQAHNIYYLPELLKWKIIKNYKGINKSVKYPLITPHPLHNPKELSVKVFPYEIKKQIQIKLENSKKEILDLIEEMNYSEKEKSYMINDQERMIDSYIDFMNSEDYSNYFRKFWKNTKKLDDIRGEDFSSLFPDFYELLYPFVKDFDFGN